MYMFNECKCNNALATKCPKTLSSWPQDERAALIVDLLFV